MVSILRVAVAVAWLGLASTACGRASSPPGSGPGGGPGGGKERSVAVAPPSASAALTADGAGAIGEREGEEWSRAEQGDDDALVRLQEELGCGGLRERAANPALRAAALRAMAHCHDFSELPFLAELATVGSDDDAAGALEAIVEQAARPRRATDPEDADELTSGCRQLLDLARARDKPKTRRVAAIRALRMLSERGCVRRAEIPSDFDATQQASDSRPPAPGDAAGD